MILTIALIITFICSIIGTKFFITYCEKNHLLGVDRHKPWRSVAVSGGLPIMFSIIVGVLTYIRFEESFTFQQIMLIVVPLLLSLLSLSIIMYVGLLDDFSKNKGGLSKWEKPALSILASIPLLIMTATMTTRQFPFIGEIELGIWYYILVPIIFIGTSNMVNLLAGFNGLEVGVATIYSGMFAVYGMAKENLFVTIISSIVFAALVGFYYFNRFPSKIFPGDSLTYLFGGYIGILVVFGKVEVQAFIAAIPYLIEGVLKARSKFQAQSFCDVNGGNKMMHTGKVYSIPHIIGRFNKFTEPQLVLIIFAFQFICSSLIWII